LNGIRVDALTGCSIIGGYVVRIPSAPDQDFPYDREPR